MENTVDNRDTRTEETVVERPTWCPADTLLCGLLAHFINLTQYKLFYSFYLVSPAEKRACLFSPVSFFVLLTPHPCLSPHTLPIVLWEDPEAHRLFFLCPPPPSVLAPSSFPHYSRPHLLLPCHPLMHLALVCPLGWRQLRQGRWWNASVPAPHPWWKTTARVQRQDFKHTAFSSFWILTCRSRLKKKTKKHLLQILIYFEACSSLFNSI